MAWFVTSEGNTGESPAAEALSCPDGELALIVAKLAL
jgi:hypothetical protein